MSKQITKKTDIISELSVVSGLNKRKSGEVMDAIINLVKENLKKTHKVKIAGFGFFEIVDRKATNGINPQTGEPIHIPETKVVKFRPVEAFKKEVRSM